MKKYILILLLSLLTLIPAQAYNIDVLPTMQSSTNVQDRVWVGTFQLVWNDLTEKVVHNVVKFPSGTPIMVNELNKQEFTKEDINPKCYYQYIGKVQKNTKKIIQKSIKKKFNETSDILDKFDLLPEKRKIFIYTMLKKDFEFSVPFDKLGVSNFRNHDVEFFGIIPQSDESLRDAVEVLFYNSPSDYAVSIKTSGNDELLLYRTATTKPFCFIYQDLIKKSEIYNGETKFLANDELRVPNLKFFEEKYFEELSGKRIKGTQLVIDKALETIKFEMDNKGVKLKSEAAMSIMKMSLISSETPRYFDFNDTFVLFLKEKDSNTPYMALRVHNIQNFQ